MAQMKSELLAELQQDPSLREAWAETMNLRRCEPKKRHETPLMKCMSTQSNTATVGAAQRNMYLLPVCLWDPKYGTLLPQRLTVRRVTTGQLEEHVVFHSLNPPNHLLDLQDFKSEQIATTRFVETDTDAFSNQPPSAHNEPTPSETTAPAQALVSPAAYGYLQPFCEGSKKSDIENAPADYTRQFFANPQNFSHLTSSANPQTPSAWAGSQATENETNAEEATNTDARLSSVKVKEEPGNVACALF